MLVCQCLVTNSISAEVMNVFANCLQFLNVRSRNVNPKGFSGLLCGIIWSFLLLKLIELLDQENISLPGVYIANEIMPLKQ